MSKANALTVPILIAALAGCVSTSCPQSTKHGPPPELKPPPATPAAKFVAAPALAVAATSMPAATPAPAPYQGPGFYRYSNDVTVYYIVPHKSACTVVSQDQMQAFGGFAQVHVVPPSRDFLAGIKGTPSACPDSLKP